MTCDDKCDAVVQKRASLDDSTSGSVARLDADAEETFRSFTETVEALALQKSVIGESHLAIFGFRDVTFVFFPQIRTLFVKLNFI